jgi:hypothetical protein
MQMISKMRSVMMMRRGRFEGCHHRRQFIKITDYRMRFIVKIRCKKGGLMKNRKRNQSF